MVFGLLKSRNLAGMNDNLALGAFPTRSFNAAMASFSKSILGIMLHLF